MTRFSAIAASLLLVACSKPEMEPLGQGYVALGENISSLAGEWRIAGIDGEPFNESYGLALSADESTIWWSPRCAGFLRSYRLDGSLLRIEKSELTGANGSEAVPVCLVAQPSRLAEVFAVLDAADRVVRTPQNAVEISGGGRKLTLFSQ